MKRTPWFARQPGGWRASVTGILVLVVFAVLFVAALTRLHNVARVIIAPLVVATFLGLAVGKTEFRRTDAE